MRERNPCTDCKRAPEEKGTIACKLCTAANSLRDIQAALHAILGDKMTLEYDCPYEEEQQ